MKHCLSAFRDIDFRVDVSDMVDCCPLLLHGAKGDIRGCTSSSDRQRRRIVIQGQCVVRWGILGRCCKVLRYRLVLYVYISSFKGKLWYFAN